MVAADVAGWIVGVLDRTFACILVESSVGAVAVSVDLFICDFVNTVVDKMSCESLGIIVDFAVELLIIVVEVGSKEGLTRGLEEAVDATRCFEEAVDATRKTPTKTIRGGIFCHSLLTLDVDLFTLLLFFCHHIVLLPIFGVVFLSCICHTLLDSIPWVCRFFSHFD